MSPQEMFDTVAKHLLLMSEQSVKENGVCAYRGKNGAKCAVGVLIPDECYIPAMDGSKSGFDISALIRYFGDLLPPWMRETQGLLIALQEVHDSVHNWASYDAWDDRASMIGELSEVAEAHHLSADVLKTAPRYEPEAFTPA